MIRKLLCRLGFHDWDEWWRETEQGSFGHWCHRCKIWEFKQIAPSEKVIPYMAGYKVQRGSVLPLKHYHHVGNGNWRECHEEHRR